MSWFGGNKDEEAKRRELLENIRKAVAEAEKAGYTVFVDEFHNSDEPSNSSTLVFSSMIRLVTTKRWWGGR